MSINISEKSNFIWKIADLLRGDYKQSEYGEVILPFTVLCRLDSVLRDTKDEVLKANATLKYKNKAPFLKNDVCTNQGFKSIVPFTHIGTAFVYFFLKNNLEAIEGRASGSTFKEVSGSIMKSIPATIPDSASLKQFNAFCAVAFHHQEILEAENSTLATLRDTLLPKLMSGELDVSEVDI